MTQNNNTPVNSSNGPEQIDLLDLVLQLWRGKWVIGAFVAVLSSLRVFTSPLQRKMDLVRHYFPAGCGANCHLRECTEYPYGSAAPSMLDIQNRAIGRFNSSFSALAQALENQKCQKS